LDLVPEPGRTYVRYALSTIERGRMTFSQIFPDLPPGFRFLDIGCAWGGFLVAAHEAGAHLVAGVDIDERLVGAARLFLNAHRISAIFDTCPIEGAHVPERLGTFDVITGINVIEHVEKVESCFSNVAALLAAEGSALLVLANRQALPSLLHDPETGLFGIGILKQEAAKQYLRCVTGTEDPTIIGHRSYDEYSALAARSGLDLQILNAAPDHLEAEVERLTAEHARLLKHLAVWRDARLPRTLRWRVRTEVASRAAMYFARFGVWQRLKKTDHERATQVGLALLRDYGWPLWQVRVRHAVRRERAS